MQRFSPTRSIKKKQNKPQKQYNVNIHSKPKQELTISHDEAKQVSAK